jgi:tetratricopeptide (TPR) repeat protein
LRVIASVLVIRAALAAADPPDYVEAVRLVQQQRWAEAVTRTRELAVKYPENPKVLNLEGLALLGSGDPPPARAAFEAALRGHPDFAPALKNLAILEWVHGEEAAALKWTDAAIKANPRDPVMNAYAAVASARRNDADAAANQVKMAGAALSALPPQLETGLAVALGESGRYAEAESVLQDLVRRGLETPTVRYNLGLAQFLAGRYADAARTLECLLQGSPSSDAFNLLALAYEKTGETQKALDTLREATLKYPADENNYLDLAGICLDHESYALGLEVIEVGLKNRPDSAKLRFQLGLLHAISGDYQRAQQDFEAAGRLEPASDLPAAALGLTAIQQSRLGDAVQKLREEVTRKTDSGPLWYLLGTALQRSGAPGGPSEQAEAAEAFRNAIRLDPRLPYPYIELGKILVRLKQPKDAVPLLEKAIELAPRERSAYYQLAIAYRQLDQPQRAAEMLEKVRDLMKQDRDNVAQRRALVKQ